MGRKRSINCDSIYVAVEPIERERERERKHPAARSRDILCVASKGGLASPFSRSCTSSTELIDSSPTKATVALTSQQSHKQEQRR